MEATLKLGTIGQTTMDILLIEDDRDIAAFLKDALRAVGYRVDHATTGGQGRKLLQEGGHDVAIVDVMLPDIDGFDVVKSARNSGVNTPVLMLTARNRVDDKVKGLDAGADDYLPKPFALDELLARLRALMRRQGKVIPEIVVDDLRLDPLTRKVFRGSKEIYLSALEFSLLSYLLRNAGRVLSKSQILNHVWDDQGYRDPNNVEVYISYVRSKVEFEGKPKLIHTVRGVGYVAEVRE